MSQENVELALRSLDALNRCDFDAALALMDEHVESVSRIVAMEGALHGHDGIRRWWDNWFDAFPDYEIEVAGVRDFGDVVITTIRALGHGSASDLPFEDNAWHASRWLDGKCVWWPVLTDESAALEVAGLSD